MKFRSDPINFNGAGDNTVIAGVSGNPIAIYAIVFTVAGATNITLKNGATALSGAFIFTGNGSSMTLPLQSSGPWYSADTGNAFIMNLSIGVQVSGTIWYQYG